MLHVWTSRRRSVEDYARLNAAEAWRSGLRPKGHALWRSCFGPWIGSDWTRVSLHTAGRFFCRQLTSAPPHRHAADDEGPPWMHGAADGWLLLRGPSSEVWFEPWVRALRQRGVSFHFSSHLERFDYREGRIHAALLRDGTAVTADAFVLAINPFSAADVVDRTPGLAGMDQLRLFRPLVSGGPHVQVSFRIAFSEPIRFPRTRTAMVLGNTEFNLTLFAQEQAWRPDVPLGQGIKSLWTGTSCVSSVPGRIHHKPVGRCTREEFIDEVLAQITACQSLDALLREANGGRGFCQFPIEAIEVWHEWAFTTSGIRSADPKWVNTTETQPYQPTQRTPVPTLVLAGAHTVTDADVWSIEAAVESGRRAAQVLDPRVRVLRQHQPLLLRFLASLDDVSFRFGGPHILDLTLVALLGATVAVVTWLALR